MRERLLTLALATGALFLFYALFAAPAAQKQPLTQPLSTERGPNGYFALYRWLDNERQVKTLRQRYDNLAAVSSGNAGNLLITTLPHRLRARPNETAQLQAWIEEGNTLLVMAGLADTPEWVMDGNHDFSLIPDLKQMTGLRFLPARQPEDDQAQKDQAQNDKTQNDKEQKDQVQNDQVQNDQVQKNKSPETNRRRVTAAVQQLLKPTLRHFEPVGTHPLMAGVKSLEALSEFPADSWRAQPADASVVVELARVTDGTASAMWLVNFGKGQIIVCGFASPFTNKLIGKRDNALLLSNIVAWSVSSSGNIILDDAHQGSVVFYDPQAFFADTRLHQALGWLLLLWLLFVLGPQRLRAADSDWHPIDIVSFVRATGGFMARTLRPNEAGRRALALFFNSIRRRLGLPENGEPVWEWLETQGKVASEDIGKLRDYYQRVSERRRVDFIGLHNLLRSVKGNFV